MARLYEYAVIQHDLYYESATVLVPPTHVTAKSEDIVRIIAARAIPANFTLERLEIIVRSFEEPSKPCYNNPYIYGGCGTAVPANAWQCETTTNCVNKA